MELSELRPGDKVLIEATVTKVVDEGEGEPAMVLAAVRQPTQTVSVSVVVGAETVHSKLSSQAAPVTEAWPLGTLGRDVHMP